MSGTEIVILYRMRTAIGGFRGGLASATPIELAATVTRAAMQAAGIGPDRIGSVVFFDVLNTQPRDMYLPRAAMVEAGLPDTTFAMMLILP